MAFSVLGVLLAVMAADAVMSGPDVSALTLMAMAVVAGAVAVRELRGRRQEARGFEVGTKDDRPVE